MPLSPPRSRSPVTARAIRCEGFRRDDGLWEVEAFLADTRTFEAPSPFRATVPAGQPFHEMWLRLAFNDDREIREIEVAIDSRPFPECPSVLPNFQRLTGLRMDAGFSKQVRERLGGEGAVLPSSP